MSRKRKIEDDSSEDEKKMRMSYDIDKLFGMDDKHQQGIRFIMYYFTNECKRMYKDMAIILRSAHTVKRYITTIGMLLRYKYHCKEEYPSWFPSYIINLDINLFDSHDNTISEPIWSTKCWDEQVLSREVTTLKHLETIVCLLETSLCEVFLKISEVANKNRFHFTASSIPLHISDVMTSICLYHRPVAYTDLYPFKEFIQSSFSLYGISNSNMNDIVILMGENVSDLTNVPKLSPDRRLYIHREYNDFLYCYHLMMFMSKLNRENLDWDRISSDKNIDRALAWL